MLYQFSNQEIQKTYQELLQQGIELEGHITYRENIAALTARNKHILSQDFIDDTIGERLAYEELRENAKVVAFLIREQRLEQERIYKRSKIISLDEFNNAIQTVMGIAARHLESPNKVAALVSECRVLLDTLANVAK